MLYGSPDRPLKLMIGLNRNMPYITYTSSLTDLTSNTTDEEGKKKKLFTIHSIAFIHTNQLSHIPNQSYPQSTYLPSPLAFVLACTTESINLQLLLLL